MVSCNAPPPVNLDLVLQQALPGVWTQVKLDSFPTNFLVLGPVPGGASTDTAPVLDVYAKGAGGLDEAAAYLQRDQVQFVGFRVTAGQAGAMPLFVCVRWIGPAAPSTPAAKAEAEFAFMQAYFYGIHAAVTLRGDAATAELSGRQARLRQLVGEALGTPWGHLDYTNAGAPDKCEHYSRMASNEDFFVPRQNRSAPSTTAVPPSSTAGAGGCDKPVRPGDDRPLPPPEVAEQEGASSVPPPPPTATDEGAATPRPTIEALQERKVKSEDEVGRLIAESVLLEADANQRCREQAIHQAQLYRKAKLRDRLARRCGGASSSPAAAAPAKPDANDYRRFEGIGDGEDGEAELTTGFSFSAVTPAPTASRELSSLGDPDGHEQAAEDAGALDVARELQETELWTAACTATHGDGKAALEMVWSTALRVAGNDAEAAFRLVQTAPDTLHRHPEMARVLDLATQTKGFAPSAPPVPVSQARREVEAGLIAELDYKRRQRQREWEEEHEHEAA